MLQPICKGIKLSLFVSQTVCSMFKKLVVYIILSFFCFIWIAAERRPMTLEDVMNFHHISLHQIQLNHDGSWMAYTAAPDHGDGYGEAVSSDGQTRHMVERGHAPRFSADGRWLLFVRRPPQKELNAATPNNRPNDESYLLNLDSGEEKEYADVRLARFSESGSFLFVHHAFTEDTLLNEDQNKALKEAGSELYILNIENQQERTLQFVDSWSVDSLATSLVFVRKDTLKNNNGLFCLALDELNSQPLALDTVGQGKFGNFTWHQELSKLVYMRAEDIEEDTLETAKVKYWNTRLDEPETFLTQEDAPEGYFLPFDNRLEWTGDGSRLYFGFRPERFAANPKPDQVFDSVIDSLRQKTAVDIWHVNDPLIKTHEKESWSRISRQNLISVFHLEDRNMVRLACETYHNVQTAPTGDYVLVSSSRPYEKRITWEGWFRDVYVMNLFTGEKQPVVEEMQGNVSLSPNGLYVLYFLNANWHSMNTLTGEHINLTEALDVPFYSETHDRPSTLPSYGMAGWMEDGHTALVYDRYDVWRADLLAGTMNNVTAGWGRENQRVLRIRKLDEDPLFGRRETVFLEGFCDHSKERAIYTARLNREGVSLLKDAEQNLRLRRLSKDGNAILFTLESNDLFPDIWITDPRFRNTRQLTSLQKQLEPLNWGQAELISYYSADGVPLQGIVIKPGDYDSSKKYPVFVYYYEKFSQRLHDFNQTVINHRPGFGYYVSNGYVVFLPDVHFVEGRPGMSAVKSLVPAVQKIIDKGIADPDAIGLHGHSWSGYQTAYVVTQTDLFKAAIAGAPVSNMTSAYGGIRWGSGLARQFQYETGQSRLGASIFDRRYLYIENSPLFYAHEINTPLLIMHGDADEAVPWEQSIELYLAMRRADKDVIFLQYRDEPHHLQNYPNKIDYTIRMKEYFDYHLRGMEPAPWIMEGVPYSGK